MFNFNKNDTKIVTKGVYIPRKTTSDIKVERLNQNRDFYGFKPENNSSSTKNNIDDRKKLVEAKRNLNN